MQHGRPASVQTPAYHRAMTASADLPLSTPLLRAARSVMGQCRADARQAAPRSPASLVCAVLWPLLLAGLSLLTGCASTAGRLPAPVSEAFREAGVPEGALALVAFPLDAPEQGWRLQPDRPMQPASTMKLVTAAVALDQLGPQARGRTELRAGGPVTDGRLDAPLYLTGGADADLDWPALWLMLREVRERRGVSDLRGGVVVDRSLFRPARLDLGAPPFDEQPEFPYNVIPDALHLNGQLLSFDLKSDAQALAVRPFPDFGGLQVDTAAVRLVTRACTDWQDGWTPPRFELLPEGGARLTLAGEFPRGCEARQSLNVLDRGWTTAQALQQLWTSLGGTLSGPVVEGGTPAGTTLLSVHRDRPLGELLRPVMKSSDNALTRLIYLRLGAAVATEAEDTRTAAERAVRSWFTAQGLDPSGLVMDNGSGLSRSERITAAQLADLLRVTLSGRYGPELLSVLPVAGVDGTLSRRFKGTAAEGRARLKTGTLRNVVALAGRVPDARDRPWIVVAIVNDEQAAKARPAIDALIAWIARSGG